MRKTERCVVIAIKKNSGHIVWQSQSIHRSISQLIESFDSFAMMKFHECRSLKCSSVFFLLFICIFITVMELVTHCSRKTFKFSGLKIKNLKKYLNFFFVRPMKVEFLMLIENLGFIRSRFIRIVTGKIFLCRWEVHNDDYTFRSTSYIRWSLIFVVISVQLCPPHKPPNIAIKFMPLPYTQTLLATFNVFQLKIVWLNCCQKCYTYRYRER